MIGAGWYRQAVVAGQMGIPDALGLSWPQWCDKYMPKLKLAMRDRQRIIGELAQQEINGKPLSNRQVAAIMGVTEATVRRTKKTVQPTASNNASTATDPQVSELPAEPAASFDASAPDSSARAERLTRDNRAEQKRAARDDREAAVAEIPKPEIRPGRLSEALADITDADLVFTDPPYGKQHLPSWSELARWARHALKPGALLIAYSGQLYLPEVLRRLSEELTYQWLGWIRTPGPNLAVNHKPIQSAGKPLVIFSNGAIVKPFSDRRIVDTAESAGRTRNHHTWEQDEMPAAYYIDALTEKGELVVDPFAGSGTFLLVAGRLERRAIGSDSDPKAFATTKARLNG